MKKTSLIGLLVGVCGVVASFAAASALYKHASQPLLKFGIGAEYSGKEGYITYKINDSLGGTIAPEYFTLGDDKNTDQEPGLGGQYVQLKYSFKLSATFTPETIHAQKFVVGKFSIDISNINEHIRGESTLIYVFTKGYNGGSLGEHYYKTWDGANNASLTSDKFSTSKEIAVASAGVQEVVMYIKLGSEIGVEDLLSYNEAKLFDIKVTWGEFTEFKNAYMVGTMTSWEEDEAYAMVPNIDADFVEDDKEWEWIYSNLKEAKTSDNNNVEVKAEQFKGTENAKWSGTNYQDYTGDHGANMVLDPSKTYNVYWSGDNDADAWYEIAA